MRGRRPAALALVGLLAACRPAAPPQGPPAAVALPERFRGAEPTAVAPALGRWWRSFGDPELDRLVEEALAGNFQLRSAWARLRQSQALLAQARATLWPTLTADANVSGSRRVFRLPAFGPDQPARDVSIEQILYGVSVGAAYEVDVWGKLGARRAAAALEADLAREQVEALAMTLAAQVADTFYSQVTQLAQAALLARQLAVNEAMLEVVETRFRRGLGPALDVHQQAQQVSATRAQIALVEAQREVLANQLALLVGRAPGTAGAPATPARQSLPALPPVPAAGLPSELVARRPDVRAARLAVAAADARAAAAVRDRFPSLVLSGNLGLAAATPTDLVESVVWSFLVGITQSIWDGGRRAAEIDRARAAIDDLVARYGEVLVTALLEVENALAAERQQRVHLEHLGAQEEQARRALETARASYVRGVTDFLHVLTALQALERVEQARLAAERQLVAQRISLHRALGGTWTSELGPPRAAKEERSR